MRVRLDSHTAHVAEWMAWQGRQLKGSYRQAEQFLQSLDPTAASFSFRTFSDTHYTRRPGQDPLERAIHGSLAECWEELTDLNRRGAAVCVTINRTNGEGRTVADIKQVRALFLDDDRPPAEVDRFPLPPQIQVVSSPGRYHHYWLVEGVSLAGFHELQIRLARHYGGDERVCSLNQSMRLPGFWRRKSIQRPLLPAIFRLHSVPCYLWDELDAALFSGCDQELPTKAS